MNSEKFNDSFLHAYPYEPTQDQIKAIHILSRFVFTARERPLFVLKGYAGTGKTSIVSTLVKVLPHAGQKAVLLTPTGRAAKVLSNYSGKSATTIHKRIYYALPTPEGGLELTLQVNRFKDTIFVVDEASMIHDSSHESGGFDGRSLLDDLIRFVYNEKNCKLILIGDQAQLPPVGSDLSPALNLNWLKQSFALTAGMAQMKQVVRQAKQSGILMNATQLREKMDSCCVELPLFNTKDYDDIERVPGYELQEVMEHAFNTSNDAVMITRSNNRANRFNQEIRTRILFREEQIDAGDRLMVVKNNYFWLQGNEQQEAGFIANGDMIEVLKINGYDMHAGFKYVNAVIQMLDYPSISPFSVLMIADTLDSPSAALTREQQLERYNAFMNDLSYIKSKGEKRKVLRKNPMYNALQVKFGYALTCHKTQGGQWKYVFVDQGYIREETLDQNYLRWLYTAVTRATHKLYLVNFRDEFFPDE